MTDEEDRMMSGYPERDVVRSWADDGYQTHDHVRMIDVVHCLAIIGGRMNGRNGDTELLKRIAADTAEGGG